MAGKRQKRQRKEAIPANMLAWQTPSGFYDNFIETPKEKEKCVFAEKVSTDFGIVEEYECALMKVEMEKTSQSVLSLNGRPFDLQAVILPKQLGGNQQDLQQFEKLSKSLMESAGRMGTSHWLQQAVLFPLGPENIKMIREEAPNLKELSHQLLVDNASMTAYLAVSRYQTVQLTTRIIEKSLALPLSRITENQVTISVPSSGFGLELNYGQAPVFVENAGETKIALVVDLERFEDELQAQHHYEDMLRVCLVSTRLLNVAEQQWVEDRLRKESDGRQRAVSGPIRLLQFESPEQRNWAMAQNQVEPIEMFFCETQVGYRTPTESLQLNVAYKLGPQVECFLVTVANAKDIHFATMSFMENGIKVADEEVLNSLDMTPLQKQRTVALRDFPRQLRSVYSRRLFIQKIAEANKFEVVRLEQFTWRPNEESKARRTVNLERLIDREIAQEGVERSWNVLRKSTGPYQDEESFTVEFRNFEVGQRKIKAVLEKSVVESVFQMDGMERGPEIIPCCRKTIAISRAIRVVFDKPIRALDQEMRAYFTRLSAVDAQIMETEEAIHFRLRIHETWVDGSEVGTIGVEGWGPQLVDAYFHMLEAILQQKVTVKVDEELLFGAGELYVKSLEQKYEGSLAVDMDKYKEEITLIGAAAEDARRDLEAYSTNKKSIGLRCDIPAHFPYMSDRIRYVLYPTILEEIRVALGVAHLEHNMEKAAFEFEGSMEAYEKVMGMLMKLNSAIYKRETQGAEKKDSACTTCLSEIDASWDFYRLECGHVMCRQCANGKVKNITASRIAIKCDAEGCSAFVSPTDILNVILGGSTRLRDFDASKMHAFVTECTTALLLSTRDAVVVCPTPNCIGVRSKSQGDTNRCKECKACHVRYCRRCLDQFHGRQSCEDYKRLKDPEESVKEFLEKAGGTVKNCPNCNALLNKESGCNHMECACGTHFCWICMFQDRESGPIYSHMTSAHRSWT